MASDDETMRLHILEGRVSDEGDAIRAQIADTRACVRELAEIVRDDSRGKPVVPVWNRLDALLARLAPIVAQQTSHRSDVAQTTTPAGVAAGATSSGGDAATVASTGGVSPPEPTAPVDDGTWQPVNISDICVGDKVRWLTKDGEIGNCGSFRVTRIGNGCVYDENDDSCYQSSGRFERWIKRARTPATERDVEPQTADVLGSELRVGDVVVCYARDYDEGGWQTFDRVHPVVRVTDHSVYFDVGALPASYTYRVRLPRPSAAGESGAAESRCAQCQHTPHSGPCGATVTTGPGGGTYSAQASTCRCGRPRFGMPITAAPVEAEWIASAERSAVLRAIGAYRDARGERAATGALGTIDEALDHFVTRATAELRERLRVAEANRAALERSLAAHVETHTEFRENTVRAMDVLRAQLATERTRAERAERVVEAVERLRGKLNMESVGAFFAEDRTAAARFATQIGATLDSARKDTRA